MSLCNFLTFRDEETEAQRNKGSHPRSHEFACVTQVEARFPFRAL